VVAPVGVLAAQVDEVAGHDVEALREHGRHGVRHRGVRAQEGRTVVAAPQPGLAHRAHCGGGGAAEQGAHLTEHGAGVVDDAQRAASPRDLDRAVDQHEQSGVRLTLADEHRAVRQRDLGQAHGPLEQPGHGTAPPAEPPA
jgi:hypothetical protein